MKHAKSTELTLTQVVEALTPLYHFSKPLRDPLAIMVWENVGYLVDDERRAELFEEFRTRIGLKAAEIANARMPILTDIAKRGGMAPQKRAERLKEIGALAISECEGDILRCLRALPLAKARSLLKKFPSIGDPGADRIILFCRVAAHPAISTDGLRALVRLGLISEHKSYSQTYKAAVEVLGRDGLREADWLERAYLVLRAHGRTLCKRSQPICEPCPLDKFCAHTLVSTGL